MMHEISRGKTKTVYQTDVADRLIMEFRDDITAFQAKKHEQLAGKGRANNHFNAFIMQTLAQSGIATHFDKLLTPTQSVVKRLDMIKLECVLRNVAAGSLCKRLGIERGYRFQTPLFELFYKEDALDDPFVSDDHAIAFGWATRDELQRMRELTLAVNRILQPLFAEKGMVLVDYKLEFGRFQGDLILGDEFTPDGCRIWDKATNEILDKDRFRQDLGEVIEHYQLIADRLGVTYTNTSAYI